MQVYGPAHLHGPQRIAAPHVTRSNQPVARPEAAPIRDELQLSEAAQALSQVDSLPEIRQDRIAAIRAEIARGTYETADKLDLAVSRLLDEIG